MMRLLKEMLDGIDLELVSSDHLKFSLKEIVI